MYSHKFYLYGFKRKNSTCAPCLAHIKYQTKAAQTLLSPFSFVIESNEISRQIYRTDRSPPSLLSRTNTRERFHGKKDDGADPTQGKLGTLRSESSGKSL